MKKSTQDKLKVGEAELALLREIATHGPTTVRDAANRSEKQLGRTTVGTMIDRLLAKGLLERSEDGSAFLYRSTHSLDELNQRLLGQFVESALGGSLQPFVAYLSGSASLSKEEVARLEDLIRKAEEGSK